MKILKTGDEARKAVKRGLDTVADCVKATLGPGGRNFLIGRLDNSPIISNDGVTVAKNIELEDPIENEGALMVKEAAATTERTSGDGTTTTVTLLQAITDLAYKEMEEKEYDLTSKVDAIHIKRQIDEDCAFFVEKLESGKRTITNDDLKAVAKVSAEYDHLASILADVFKIVGKDGYVAVEYGNKPISEYTVNKGMSLDTGYPNELFITGNKQCVVERPNILVTAKSVDLSILSDIAKLVSEKLASTNKEKNLIIVAPEFEHEAMLRIQRMFLGGFRMVPIKLQDFNNFDRAKDICALTGATFIEKITPKKIFEYDLSILGGCEELKMTESKTFFIGGNGDTTKRVAELRKIHTETQSIYDKEQLDKRIAYLLAGTAIIKVGASTEAEKTYFKMKVDDAVKAVQNAMKNGVVKGGGLALKELAEQYPDRFISKALSVPYETIQRNAGGNLEIASDVEDAFDTIATSLKNACSLAGVFITIEGVTTYKKDEGRDESQS